MHWDTAITGKGEGLAGSGRIAVGVTSDSNKEDHDDEWNCTFVAALLEDVDEGESSWA